MARKSKTKKRRSMEDILKDEEQEEEGIQETEEEEKNTEDSSQETEEEETAVIAGSEKGGPVLAPVEPPPPQVNYYSFETAMKRVLKGIKVCRSIWPPDCFLIDLYRRMNGRNAVCSWNPGKEDKNAGDWMDFAVRLRET